MRGTLVLVVGPSGAGKDSMIHGARAALGGSDGFHFARRCITRPAASGGEDHRPVGYADFVRARARGGFALSWTAHGLGYGIPKAIERHLARGRCVVANVSRAAIADARARFAPVLVVHVTAPPEILAARLAERRREDEAAIRARLTRAGPAVPVGPGTVEIVNDGALDATVSRFVALLLGQRHALAGERAAQLLQRRRANAALEE